MALDIALSRATHDLAIDRTGAKLDLILIDNAERVAQQIKVALLLWLGEYFLDTTAGTPYLTQILIKNPKLSAIRSALYGIIAAVPDVDQVVSLDLTFDRQARTLTVTYEAATTFGNVNRSVAITGSS